ncbi:hypothetical protein IU485_01495 [Nocardia cyriacigeorgica]|uniref:DUF5994 family protein n=1 Tax=Nocardia TaxID=1817 RepID=UPI000C013081|nr:MULTISPECIES: DUF5994 family protein [Nocardia]MBF6080032.1 hypothetical protein [Nocardia cyriacigeorgica]MBF6289633.1 hypothetical protein [Nocardia cyriacigeorgica]MBF6427596.1 hypothetical protein [Nocardia cyriacigeorgica]PFW98643.1 hypothetical protein CJ469_06044 [Nocardia farcinica]PFX03257.1 hypothetical protein CJ468_05660 [Nocardia farcinica]
MTPSPLPPPRTLASTPRLHLHQDPKDYIDATWQPRSSDLVTELPALLTALQLRTGPISRVVYDPTVWSPASSHLLMDERAIRLDPYPFELFDTMYVYGTNGAVMVLQIVRPSTDPAPTVTGEPTRSTASNAPGRNHEPRPITNHAAMGTSTDQ